MFFQNISLFYFLLLTTPLEDGPEQILVEESDDGIFLLEGRTVDSQLKINMNTIRILIGKHYTIQLTLFMHRVESVICYPLVK